MRLVRVLFSILGLAGVTAGEERTGPGGIRYDLVLASGAKPGEPRDLVLALHGKGGKKESFAEAIGSKLPELKDSHRVWLQCNQEHWGRGDVAPLTELARRLRRELPVRNVILIGFSAGGFAATGMLFEQHQVFDAALIAGATWWGRPSNEEAKKRPIFWSFGDQDSVVNKNGGPEHLKKALAELGYPEERWTIDVVAGLGHNLDGPSLQKGLAFLRGKLAGDDRVHMADDAGLKTLSEAVKKGELDKVRAAVDTLLAARRLEVRRKVAEAIVPLISGEGDQVLLGLEVAARTGEPLLAGPLAKARGKAKKDEARSLALVKALGALEAGAGLPLLLDLLGDWDLEGKTQVAAAQALGEAGNPGAIDGLTAALKAAEKKKGREDYAKALQEALAAIRPGK